MLNNKPFAGYRTVAAMAALAGFIAIADDTHAQSPAPAPAAPAAEAWRSKPVTSWTDRDADQILERSPWAHVTVAGIARRQTEDERRQGGNMGQPTGVGYDGIDDRRVRPILPRNVFSSAPTPPSKAQIIHLLVRWESAMPVQAAELKRGEASPPTLSDNCYAIAVYGVPWTDEQGDPLQLAKFFKESAFLKREGKPDVKPFRVEAFELEHSVVVVYEFPYWAEISKKDTLVEFSALIGRLEVDQKFNVPDMFFQGKLEL
jgi:hypothetical protein